MTTHIKDSAFRAYEHYILNEKNIDEALKNLVEGSDSYNYLKCIDLIVKKKNDLTTEERDFISNYINFNKDDNAKKIALRMALNTLETAKSEDERGRVLKDISKMFWKLSFEHQQPDILFCSNVEFPECESI